VFLSLWVGDTRIIANSTPKQRHKIIALLRNYTELRRVALLKENIHI